VVGVDVAGSHVSDVLLVVALSVLGLVLWLLHLDGVFFDAIDTFIVGCLESRVDSSSG